MWRNLEIIACTIVFLLALFMIVWNIFTGFSISVSLPMIIIALISIYYLIRELKAKNEEN
ncbi:MULTISPECIES: hypothetical protein [Staphylococcus]|uniref:hypothetical protein n=1 Tax=Staphylococcus TaxID=1279 RepID=UPI0002DA0165|nr:MULTISPECIES: hypothetical protein [Staphylococcus]MBL3398905.1 hypothetical protein [Staphylococcus pasteuri]MBM6506075.1 hypothetical protein [Staphylococcus pasteuri]MEB7434624.1 hypothetical protein [Staphylococcus pasteuri]PTU82033.1 hypothetical protein BUZ66_07805 [Staphylococcus pasteuri]PTU83280.1 hypothetical protein BUZ62_12325 [Staphylococcus pasteuri]